MRNAILSLAAVSALAISASARAAITVDGSLDSDYGSALAVNVNPTGFGDSNYTAGPDTPDANGSELDAGYGVVEGSTLYLFLAGNVENNGNHWNVFVDDGRVGQSTLAVPATGTMQAMNGSVFSPGFQATYALDVNDYQGTAYCEEYTLSAPGILNGGYTGSFSVPTGIGSGADGSATVGLNNSNTGGVTGSSGSTASSLAVTTGLEVAIPLSSLGGGTGPFLVMADINGGGDGYLSNQFLPGLPSGTGNLGTAGFNFGTTPGEYFVVSAPEPTTMGLVVGAVSLLAARRRKA